MHVLMPNQITLRWTHIYVHIKTEKFSEVNEIRTDSSLNFHWIKSSRN